MNIVFMLERATWGQGRLAAVRSDVGSRVIAIDDEGRTWLGRGGQVLK
jgi:hypothetical protein